MNGEIVMKGPRLHLMPTEPSDIGNEFADMYSNSDGKNAFFRQSGRDFSIDELRDYCEEGLRNQTCFYYTVRSNEDNKMLGSIRVGVIDKKNSISDLVALIGSTGSRGRGLGTEAIRLGNKVAFDRHSIRKLHGGVLEPNGASLTAYLRAGWVVEGRLLNHFLLQGKPVDWIIISCFNPFWNPPENPYES